MSGWYDLKKSSSGEFYFVLKGGNGEAILTSQMYESKASAENGIASARQNCEFEDRFERTTAANGKFHFNLKSPNQQVIGSSELYATTESRDEGISAVMQNGRTGTVHDKT